LKRLEIFTTKRTKTTKKLGSEYVLRDSKWSAECGLFFSSCCFVFFVVRPNVR